MDWQCSQRGVQTEGKQNGDRGREEGITNWTKRGGNRRGGWGNGRGKRALKGSEGHTSSLRPLVRNPRSTPDSYTCDFAAAAASLAYIR